MKIPSVDDVDRYCRQHDYRFVDPKDFVSFHARRDWKIHGKPMRNWRRAVTTWQKRQESQRPVELTIGKRGEGPMPPLFAQILRLSWTQGKGWPYNR